MARSGFRLDRRGVSEILRTQSAALVTATAERVAAAVRSQIDDDSIPVEVTPYTTDRGAAAVTVADASGMELQARGGVLTRGAAAAGLEVTAR